jgi:DNA-binding MarR family transcriptional regulator/N-acetylglutamate synthase-like GNAT family acetyltransferase
MSKTSLTSASESPTVTDADVAGVREFNRFYTNVLGLLREGLLDTPYSLTEARVIFELAREEQTEAAQLRRWLDIDAGYLSRLLARFEADGIVRRSRSTADGRRQVIGLTPAGRAVFAKLDALSADQIRGLLDALSADQIRGLLAGLTAGRRASLIAAMAGITDALDGAPRARAVVIRAPLPGELGWVVQRNAALYAAEYGWDESYEALVARIVADYAARADRAREAAWIAEVDGQPAGCVFCMRKSGGGREARGRELAQSDEVAQLRLLLVEPQARGMGIGDRLVAECLAFARRAGYREIVLWTNDVLHAARRIYQRAGFELAGSQEHHSFGHDLVGQDWRLPLT